MVGICWECDDNVKDVLPLLFDYDKKIYWKKWEKNYENGRVHEIELKSSAAKAIEELQAQLPKFKMHFYVNNVQSEHFKNVKETIYQDAAIIQIDFAENFSIFTQDEVQAAHFSYEQVTVFTCCIWMENKTQSIAIISNDLSHDKYSVFTFLKTILDFLIKKNVKLKKFHIFSDGCASQFKNKFVLSSLIMLQTIYNAKITWSFFATSHGKGAVDGIGATVKRCVWAQIKSRQITIHNAEDFANCATDKLKNIKIFYKNKDAISSTRVQLSPIWEHSSLPGIQKLQLKHFVEASQNRIISRFTFKSTKYLITEYLNYIHN